MSASVIRSNIFIFDSLLLLLLLLLFAKIPIYPGLTYLFGSFTELYESLISGL